MNHTESTQERTPPMPTIVCRRCDEPIIPGEAHPEDARSHRRCVARETAACDFCGVAGDPLAVCTFLGSDGSGAPHRQPQMSTHTHNLCPQCVAEYTTPTIWAPSDRDGTLVDTGFQIGERVIVTLRGRQVERIVTGPSPQPYESVVYDGPAWGRRIKAEPALRVVDRESSRCWTSYPCRWISRVADVAAVASRQQRHHFAVFTATNP